MSFTATLMGGIQLCPMNCPFCSPDIKASVFARSGNFVALYNRAPVFPGHSLVIPEHHVGSLLELGEAEAAEMISFSQKVTRLLLQVFNAEAFDWSVQDGVAAGQSIAHLHLHIVPRRTGDRPDPGDWYPEIAQNTAEILDSAFRPKIPPDELEQIVKKLREQARKEELF